VLVCRSCGGWYPISDHVADMLPAAHAEAENRRGFFDAHRVRLEELGLDQPAAPAPDRDFAAQAHQRDHFDHLASRQDRFSYGALGRQPFQRALRSLSFEEWAPLIRPGSLVLDIGCANGLSTFDIARFDVEVIGIDISGQQIRLAAERAEHENYGNVTFMVADADSLPIADRAVDCVLCYGALHHVPAPERTLNEVGRVLKPGGSYLGVENNTTPLRPIFDALMRLRPIWLEEAGAEAQIGSKDLHRWTEQTDLTLNTRATVYVPPQLCNLLGYRVSRRLLRISDWVFGRIPWLRSWGGLLSITGRVPQPGAGPAPRREVAVGAGSADT
jgi:ubiquinone/menaquinone biosynthesis C-methylase UbiE